jgi:hypothetical protein
MGYPDACVGENVIRRPFVSKRNYNIRYCINDKWDKIIGAKYTKP